MATGLRGDKLILKAMKEGSVTAASVIAGSTDVTISFSAEALETTSQTSGLNASFIAGKVSCTASGSFLLASDNAELAELFSYMNAGSLMEVEVYNDSTKIFDGDAVITSLEATGGLSDSLATGSYSLQCSGDMATA